MLVRVVVIRFQALVELWSVAGVRSRARPFVGAGVIAV